MKKLLFIGFVATMNFGCASIVHLTDGKDAWIKEKYLSSDVIFYCKSNATDTTAAPVCYQAKMADKGSRIGIAGAPTEPKNSK